MTPMDGATEPAEQVRMVLLPGREPGAFDPAHAWADLGLLIEGMEERGYYLMLNSAVSPRLKRVASFHRVTAQGFPCAGSSEWGPFATVGAAVLAAAHEALFAPRTQDGEDRA